MACYIIFNVILGDNYVLLLSQNNAQVIQDFAIWQLFTSMFMHANLLHIGSNMVALFIFGIAAEQFFSKWEYLVIYLVSGLVGNLFSLFLLPLNTISLGASGAIYGLAGATFLIVIRTNRQFVLWILIYMAYMIIYSFTPGVDSWAHIFGFLAGLGLCYLFRRKEFSTETATETPISLSTLLRNKIR